MNRPDYADFDKALQSAISQGSNTMMKLEHRDELKNLSAPFCIKQPGQRFSTPHFRIVDRRLQALRKNGAIRFNGKTWEVV